MSTDEQILLKDSLNKEAVSRLSAVLTEVWPKFDALQFQIDVFNRLDKLELKQRVSLIIDALHTHLPDDFTDAAEILFQIPDCPGAAEKIGGFIAWPLLDYVSAHGQSAPEVSLLLLRRLTSLFSAEFAIRTFIEMHWDITRSHLLQWVKDDNHHVRRLASEGIRPRLPWGKQLPRFIASPNEVIAILDHLKDDDSPYVQKSVANNLNDISKDHPELVIDLCRKWQIAAPASRLWIIRHATRTLVKEGHPAVFALLGFSEKVEVEIEHFFLDREQVIVGEVLSLTFDLVSTSDFKQKLVVDYTVQFVRANGKRSGKVFKLKIIELEPKQRVKLSKRVDFSPITTRRYYEGEHGIEIVVNGKAKSQKTFMLYV